MNTLLQKWVLVAVLALTGAGAVAVTVHAQDSSLRSPVLTIDSERLYLESLYAKRVQKEIEAEAAVIEAENRRIEAELIEEEQKLTEQRSDLAPEVFRELADTFDVKVQNIRNERRQKLQEVAQRSENARRTFLTLMTPVLEDIMGQAGAAIIVESRSVFISAKIIDVTDTAIAGINARIGDGSDLQ